MCIQVLVSNEQDADAGAYKSRLEECLAQCAAYEAELRRSHAECEKHTEVRGQWQACLCNGVEWRVMPWCVGDQQETRNDMDSLKRRLANCEAEK
jgi:hypothetical protein